MRKIPTLLIFLNLLITVSIAVGAGNKQLLRDGFVLTGVDGKLVTVSSTGDSNTPPESPERWFFQLASDITDYRTVIKAGQMIELLPSAALENMTAYAEGQENPAYRLYNGIVTTYKGKNFIFPDYFLLVGQVEPSKQVASGTKQLRPLFNEPNDPLMIPEQIIAQLTTSKVIRTPQLKAGLELKQNFILADRSGFIEKDEEGLRFVPDGLGRNAPKVSLRLLPCYVLERAQEKQAGNLGRLRFKVAGIVTEYKGDYYLLLQRASRVYSHGNFGR